MPDSEPWNPVHPDWLVGPDLDVVMLLFGDVDWQERTAVEQRVADLHAAYAAGFR